MAKNDTYKEIREFIFPNAKVRVHIPDLTPEERARRMKLINDAAVDLLMNGKKEIAEANQAV